MLITPHMVVGSTIGAAIDNPWIVIVLALLSHFLLDMIPHYDIGTRHFKEEKIVLDWKDWLWFTIDGVAGIALTYYIYTITGGHWLVWLGAAVGIAPDIIDDIFRVSVKNGKLGVDMSKKIPVISAFHRFHEKIHYKLRPEQWYVGVLTQVLVVVLCLYILI